MTRRAFLYCTYFERDLCFLGEIHDEGSMRDLIQAHCARHGNDHAGAIHILIDGTPESDAVREAMDEAAREIDERRARCQYVQREPEPGFPATDWRTRTAARAAIRERPSPVRNLRIPAVKS